METIQTNDVKVIIKSIGTEGILMRDTKEFTEKGEEIKTTEYFLDVNSENTTGENAQFIAVEGDPEVNDDAQFVAVEVSDSDHIILHEKEVILWNELCRICANGSDRFIPIFSGEGLDHNLCNKINTYLPLEVSINDTLPLHICYNCAATLLAWHDMFKGCFDAQQRLTELQTKLKDQYYNDSAMEETTENVLEVESENCGMPKDDEKTVNNDEIVEVDDPDSERLKLKDEELPPSTSEFEINNEELLSSPIMDPLQEEESNHLEDETAEQMNEPEEEDQYTYMCGVCDKLYKTELQLLKHLRLVYNHRGERKVPLRYECHICSKSYIRKSRLIDHLESHGRQLPGEAGVVERSKFFMNGMLHFRCEFCNRVVSQRRSFLRHIRVHKDERPVVCTTCNKTFRIEDDLRRHIDDVHRKIKRFPCDICGTPFAAKNTRDAHRRIHTGEKPFPCKVCGKTFRSINLLGVHKRTHTDYRPHQCSFCEKAFRDRQKLAAHEAIHTGNRPYPCDVCGKSFAAKGEANRHRSVHFAEKPFLCSQCGLRFRLNRYLRSHIKLHHSDQADMILSTLEN